MRKKRRKGRGSGGGGRGGQLKSEEVGDCNAPGYLPQVSHFTAPCPGHGLSLVGHYKACLGRSLADWYSTTSLGTAKCPPLKHHHIKMPRPPKGREWEGREREME